MKRIQIILLGMALLFSPGLAKAQSHELQQLLLNIEKLTQLKSILSDMKTGYQIYQQGYGMVSNLSKGNFDLHQTFYNGLLQISPAVRNYARVADIVSMQAKLIAEYKSKQNIFRSSGRFSITELNYLGAVYADLVRKTLNDAEELANTLRSGKLRMSDADRIKAIDRIYMKSADRLEFLRYFNNQGTTLSLQRGHEASDTRNVGRLYGLK